MLTAVGAEAWPSGDQVWNGNTPPREPKPSHSRGNAHSCRVRSYLNAPRWAMSKLVLPAATYMANMATRMKAEPTRSIRVSFMAAYSRPPMSKSFHTNLKGPASAIALLEPQMPMSRYIGNTAIS